MADLCCIWLFVIGRISMAKGLAYGLWLYARFVCYVQRRCSCSCRLWRYIIVMPLHLEAAYAALAALYVTDRAVVQPRLQPKPALTGWPAAIQP